MSAWIHLVLWGAAAAMGAWLWRTGTGGLVSAVILTTLVACAGWAAWRAHRAARRRRSALQYVQMAKQPIALG